MVLTSQPTSKLTYLVVQCPGCGNVQGISSKTPYKASLNCHKCGKHVKLYTKHGTNVKIIKFSKDPFEIMETVKHYRLNPYLLNFKG